MLFVHGIGEQRQYSTLARFGGALQRWLRQWKEPPDRDDEASRVAPPPVVEVAKVEAHPGGGVPANARVAVSDDQEWLLAEAWWAPEVTPPSANTNPSARDPRACLEFPTRQQVIACAEKSRPRGPAAKS